MLFFQCVKDTGATAQWLNPVRDSLETTFSDDAVTFRETAKCLQYSNMLQSMDELIIQGTSSFPRGIDKRDLCDDNRPSFKQSTGRVRIT